MTKPNQTCTISEVEEYLDALTDEQAGKLIKEYVGESNHNSWEGFSSRDLIGIRRFLSDLRLAGENGAARLNTEEHKS